MDNKYTNRGVSSKKEDVHNAISALDKGIFPGGFCKAVPYFFDKDKVFLMHADGAGTKSSLAYLYWKETGDKSVFRGIAQDAFVMNLDDLLCVGAVDNFYVSSTIGRNKNLIPGEILKEIIDGTEECVEMIRGFGANIKSVGGETADVGDLVRTIIVDSTFSTVMNKVDYVDASNIKPNMVIVGLSSYGQTTYEKQYNSGIGSNGLTSARHDVLGDRYKKEIDTYDGHVDKKYIYSGSRNLTDALEGTSLNVGQAILSPTRTYYPIIKDVLKELGNNVPGIIHCSGGGQAKCKKFSKHIKYVKNNLFQLPPLFELLSKENEMKDMFEIFNGGHRMELYVEEKYAKTIIDVASKYKLGAKIVGYTEYSEKADNVVELTYQEKTYVY